MTNAASSTDSLCAGGPDRCELILARAASSLPIVASRPRTCRDSKTKQPGGAAGDRDPDRGLGLAQLEVELGTGLLDTGPDRLGVPGDRAQAVDRPSMTPAATAAASPVRPVVLAQDASSKSGSSRNRKSTLAVISDITATWSAPATPELGVSLRAERFWPPRRDRGGQPRLAAGDEFLDRQLPDIAAVDRPQLLDVEEGRRQVDLVEPEFLDQGRPRHISVYVTGRPPAQQHQVVDHRLGQVALGQCSPRAPPCPGAWTASGAARSRSPAGAPRPAAWSSACHSICCFGRIGQVLLAADDMADALRMSSTALASTNRTEPLARITGKSSIVALSNRTSPWMDAADDGGALIRRP